MDSLESLITRTRDGDDDAYGLVVRRFQDMAVGYGYSILRDFQLAEDAAQEAFFEAYRSLSSLREPAAAPRTGVPTPTAAKTRAHRHADSSLHQRSGTRTHPA